MAKSHNLTLPPRPTFYGSTTVGSRGQIVIPIKARRDFKLKNSDEMLVAGMHGRFLMICKLSELRDVVEELTDQVKAFRQVLTKSKIKKS